MNLSDFVLRYRLGEGEWQIYSLLGENTLIGRGDDNDLMLEHREVSRHHLRLRLQDDIFQIIDLESSNGTRLDGISLVPQIPSPIRPGQIIEIGDFSLLLEKSEEGSTHISRELLPYLIRYRFGKGTWQTFPLESGEKVIGRDPECDFHFNDSEVSRQHVRIRIGDDGVWLTDLGSTNGTKVNNVELIPHEEHKLQLGQMFSVGNFILQIDEPSRFYKAPSVIVGKPDIDKKSSLGVQVENMQTVIDADAVLKPSPPTGVINLMSRKRVTIGRGARNDVVLDHPLVNRDHAVIERAGTRFRIRDLRSANGVFVNGKPIEQETDLNDWDQIRIGSFAFVLSGDDLQYQIVNGLKIEALNLHQNISNSLDLLQNINLEIHPHDYVALIGVSGSGRTTLLNTLSGYGPASHGRVLINNVDLYEHYDLLHNDFGYLPQADIVHTELPPETALNYIARLRLPPDTTQQERDLLIAEVLGNLELTESRHVPISQLTDEQRKRISIGCELLIKPRLLFLDEPGLDLAPGAAYDIMKLIRRLADQGRTVISVTQATNNVMLCDKVIILAQDGNLAFFGTPEDALNYFNQYRSDDERSEKEISFVDIDHILSDGSRGAPPEWRKRYLSSHAYQLTFGIDPRLAEMEIQTEQLTASKAADLTHSVQKLSGWRQFFVLTSRNLKILAQDKLSLALMLGLAPLLGLLDFIWGRNTYDPVNGDASKIIMLWFVSAIVTLSVGALSSVREIVKEVAVYNYERRSALKIVPYLLSKVWLGVVLALYQAGALLFFRYKFVNPNLPTPTAFLELYFTFFLGITTGYLLGLLISSISTHQKTAIISLSVIMIILILFTGVFLPLDWIPGGTQISVLMPSRWIFESFVRITELGEELRSDPCWTGYAKTERYHLSSEAKEVCACMGASIFSDCADFPGILSPDFYSDAAQVSFGSPEPIEPPQPTTFSPPTAIPSPTPLPSLTPYPTPHNPDALGGYLEKIFEQGEEYQQLVADQFEQYRLDSVIQSEEYFQVRGAQEEEYAAAMQTYSDELVDWEKNRDQIIHYGEALLGSFYDNYRQVFQGTLLGRWIILVMLQLGLFILTFLAQKKKDGG